MASLQIPFSRWDWPDSESLKEDNEVESGFKYQSSSNNNHPESHNHNNIHNQNYNRSNHHSHSLSPTGHHRSDFPNCSHPKSNPIAASLSSLSAMLLEGQAVLAHQTLSEIWLFIGLSNGSIWKWSINFVKTHFIPLNYLFIYLY